MGERESKTTHVKNKDTTFELDRGTSHLKCAQSIIKSSYVCATATHLRKTTAHLHQLIGHQKFTTGNCTQPQVVSLHLMQFQVSVSVHHHLLYTKNSVCTKMLHQVII